MEIAVIILVVGLMVALGIWGTIQARRRRDALRQSAERLGLQFDPENDYGVDERYGFLNKLCQGSNRYAFNILSGVYQGHPVCAFDYHYETYSRDSDGDRRTEHHYFSFFILGLPRVLPELTVSREDLLSKIAQFVGYDDIDFESAEFSRTFCVRSKDKKFAYDICHGRMMEYLLANRDLNLEIERECLALFFPRRLELPEVERNLGRMVELRGLLPEYLWRS